MLKIILLIRLNLIVNIIGVGLMLKIILLIELISIVDIIGAGTYMWHAYHLLSMNLTNQSNLG